MIKLKMRLSLFAAGLFIMNSASSVVMSTLPVKDSTMIGAQKVHETCFTMEQHEAITFNFNATDPIKFNLHYHTKEQVIYPIADQLTPKFNSTQFVAPVKQTYCLMWRNLQSTTVELKFNVSKSKQ